MARRFGLDGTLGKVPVDGFVLLHRAEVPKSRIHPTQQMTLGPTAIQGYLFCFEKSISDSPSLPGGAWVAVRRVTLMSSRGDCREPGNARGLVELGFSSLIDRPAVPLMHHHSGRIGLTLWSSRKIMLLGASQYRVAYGARWCSLAGWGESHMGGRRTLRPPPPPRPVIVNLIWVGERRW